MEIFKYNNYDITLQEIPNEISLVFSIVGCKLACVGCHSDYLWDENNGIELTDDVLLNLLDKYKDSISCVVFMGGEWNEKLIEKLDIIINQNIKTALYTGQNLKYVQNKLPEIYNRLDYLKTGRWVQKLGGLGSPNTNQQLWDIKNNKIVYFRSV